jgi:hypothetical protein
MRQAVKAARAALALVLSFASPVLAQSSPPDLPPRPQPGAALPPHEVLTSVRSIGLDPVSRPQLRGRVYVLRAVDASQFEKRVVVDARSGEVLAVRDLINVPPAYTPYNPRYGRYEPPRPPGMIARATVPPPDAEPLLDEPMFPRAGRGMPSAGAGQRSAAMTPHTPLPKVRPASPAVGGTITTGSTDAKDVSPPQNPAAASAGQPAATSNVIAPAPPPAMPSAAALVAAATTPGKSIPAPVAARAAHEARAEKPVQMVPVAPLE